MDCHGVESFHLASEGRSGFYEIRAASNPQRSAAYYTVDLSEKESNAVELLLQENKWEGACVFLKDIGVQSPTMHMIERCPNPSLDPMSAFDEEEEDHK
jgi:hypothetical protein